MSGIEMMLKAFGVNPAELMQKAEEFKTALDKFVIYAGEARDTMQRIEAATTRIEIAIDGLKSAPGGLRNLTLPDDQLLQFAKPKLGVINGDQ